jgi:hypothetical protein
VHKFGRLRKLLDLQRDRFCAPHERRKGGGRPAVSQREILTNPRLRAAYDWLESERLVPTGNLG